MRTTLEAKKLAEHGQENISLEPQNDLQTPKTPGASQAQNASCRPVWAGRSLPGLPRLSGVRGVARSWGPTDLAAGFVF